MLTDSVQNTEFRNTKNRKPGRPVTYLEFLKGDAFFVYVIWRIKSG